MCKNLCNKRGTPDPIPVYIGYICFSSILILSATDNNSYAFAASDSFGSLKQLKNLNLGVNRFNNSILPYLNTLTSLTTLILRSNYIEGWRTKQGIYVAEQ